MNTFLRGFLGIIFTITFFVPLQAQFTCDSTRFLLEVFDSVEVSTDVVYGNNGRDLLMDVYEPKGDSMEERPVLVLAFGGSFAFGSKEDGYMVELATSYAKRGYVAVSIDYRLTPSIIVNPSNTNFYGAVLKATHDMRAAVRYFRKEVVENNNPFRIDTSLIYAGGVSAGAITAIHLAYLRDESEYPPEMDTTGAGGIEGLSGNLGYSSEVAGVINLCGAVGDSSWINSGEARMLSMHGDNDAVVPYNSGNVVIFNANLPVDGSASMHIRMQNEGIINPFQTWPGAGHTPFIPNFSLTPDLYMDSVLAYTSDILYDWLCEYYASTTSVNPAWAEELDFTVFPNPALDQFQVNWDKFQVSQPILKLFSVTGQEIELNMVETNEGVSIPRNALPPGYYILSFTDVDKGIQIYQNVLLR